MAKPVVSEKNKRRKELLAQEAGEAEGKDAFREKSRPHIGGVFDVNVQNDQRMSPHKGLICVALVVLGPRPTTYGKLESFCMARHPSGMKISEFSEETKLQIKGLEFKENECFILVSNKNARFVFA